MKSLLKLIFTSLITFFILTSCEKQNKANQEGVEHQVIEKDEVFLEDLIETQLGETKYYVSIPEDYTLEGNDVSDFAVYYFYPADTLIAKTYSGGFYFGNHPSLMEQNDSCSTRISKMKMLNQQAEWTIYTCPDEYFMQTLIDSESGEDWNQTIHAFGEARSKEELKKLERIFSSLKMKEE